MIPAPDGVPVPRERGLSIAEAALGDPETRTLYALAARLGTSLGAVLDMHPEEVSGWIAYFEREDRPR